MLGQIPGYDQQQFIEFIEIGDLSMRSQNIPVYHPDQSEVLQEPESPPVCRLATPWGLGDLALFGIDLAIISPKPEEPESHLSLASGQPQYSGQAIPDLMKATEEELR